MQNIEADFRDEFTELYSSTEYNEVSQLIEDMWNNADRQNYHGGAGKLWSLSYDVEKVAQFQEIWHINLCKEVVDIEGNECYDDVNIAYESGIDNGTLMSKYSLCGTPTLPLHRTMDVLDDIEIDWAFYGGISRNRVEWLFEVHKNKILELCKQQSYDEYATGGTYEISKYYESEFKKYTDMKLHWRPIYKEVQYQPNIR